LATPGIKQLVESGDNTIMINEDLVNKAVYNHATTDGDTLIVSGLQLERHNRMISSIARLQPSADGVDGFLTGFTDFEPVNTDSYSWYDEFVIDTFPLESGVNSAGDMRPIHDSSGSQGHVTPAARWDCKRVETLSKAIVDDIKAEDTPVSTFHLENFVPNEEDGSSHALLHEIQSSNQKSVVRDSQLSINSSFRCVHTSLAVSVSAVILAVHLC
jgi:hypothetical protein